MEGFSFSTYSSDQALVKPVETANWLLPTQPKEAEFQLGMEILVRRDDFLLLVDSLAWLEFVLLYCWLKGLSNYQVFTAYNPRSRIRSLSKGPERWLSS